MRHFCHSHASSNLSGGNKANKRQMFLQSFAKQDMRHQGKTERKSVEVRKRTTGRSHKSQLQAKASPRQFFQQRRDMLQVSACQAEIVLRTNFIHTSDIGSTTMRSFYTDKFLHTEVFTHRSFSQRSLYTEKILHRETFAQKSVCTGKLLHTEVFTQRNFYMHLLRLVLSTCGVECIGRAKQLN